MRCVEKTGPVSIPSSICIKHTPVSAPAKARRGLKIAWLAKEGQTVKAGDVIARFDPTEAQKSLESSEASRNRTQSEIDRENKKTALALRGRRRTEDMAALELEQTKTFQRKDELIFSRHQIIESEIDGTD